MRKIGIAFILLLWIFISGCTSKDVSDNSSIEKELNIIKHDNNELKIQVQKLQEELEKKEEEYAISLKENKEFLTIIETKSAKIDNLKAKLETMRNGIEAFNLEENYEDEKYFIPNEEYVQGLIMKATEVGNNFTIGNTLRCDYNAIQDKDGYSYCLVTENNIKSIDDLKEYFSNTYTQEVIHQSFLEYESAYKEFDGNLYANAGEKGGSRIWNRDIPKLVKIKLEGKELIYSVNAYEAFDETLTSFEAIEVSIKFIEGKGWRVNTFITN